MTTQTPETIRSDAHEYRVLEALGRGGQGHTLLVERTDEPGSRYVLKQLRMEHVDDWKQVELFEREVATLRDLDHAGIPRLVDRVVEDGRTAGIVQTLVPGHTLAKQIDEHGPLSPARFEAVLRELLGILAYLHGRVPPVMHRDVNPRNVMLDGDRAYLIDFGSVRVGGKTDMTAVGTFGYMAPEQIIGRPVPASDLYGLGMTMISLAERREVGDLPVDASTGQVDRSKLLRGVEPRVRDVVLAMIEPGLEQRLGDAARALRRLDAPPVPALREPVAVAPRDSSPNTGRGLLVGMGLASVLAAVAAGVVFLSSAPSSTHESTIAARPAPVPVTPAVPPVPPPAPPVQPDPQPAIPEPPTPAPSHPVTPKVVPTELTDDNSAELTVVTKPKGLRVLVDDVTHCTSPCAVRLTFGLHRVAVDFDGKVVERSVNLLEDMDLTVSLTE